MSKKLWTLAGVFLFLFALAGFTFGVWKPVWAQGLPPASAPGQSVGIGAAVGGVITGIKAVDDTTAAVAANQANNTQSAQFTDNTAAETIMATLFTGILGNPKEVADAGGNMHISYTGGLVGSTDDLITAMVDHPVADPQAYVADLLHSSGLINQPVYAQGLGFAALDPVLSVWKIFRNIAYFFFVVAFLVIGIMIMLRQKIGSQTVITAQQAIPSIIVALLAVTFSYAIAGLLIDLMYVIMYLMVGLFGKNSQTLINGNFLQLGYTIIGGATGDVASAVSQFINGTLGGGVLSGLAAIAGGVTAALIFAVAIAIGIFRLFFNLLRRYVAIVIAVALAPLILMVSAIPGRNTFNSWLKGLVGNLAAFPILLMALIVSDTITGALSGTTPQITGGGFLPPYLGGAGTGGSLAFIVGLGILLVLSELVDKGAEAFGAGKGPFDSIAEAAEKNFRGAVNSAKKIEQAQPFDFDVSEPSFAFRTTGKETFPERLLLGTRAFRASEETRAQNAKDLFGREDITPRQGGLLGAYRNPRKKTGDAEKIQGNSTLSQSE